MPQAQRAVPQLPAESQPHAEQNWRQEQPLELSPTLAAALDAFYENGYHGATVRDIARRTGFTVPALYYYHENKEAMLFAVLEQSIDRVTELCETALAAAGGSPAARFCNLIECLVLFMTHSRKTAYLDHEIRALSPAHRVAHVAKRKRVELMVVAAVRDGVEVGVFDVVSPAESARAILGMVQSVATWFRPDGPDSPEFVAQAYVDIAARAVSATPDVLVSVAAADRRSRPRP